MDSPSSKASDQQSSTQKLCLACNQTFGSSLSHCPKDGTQLIVLNHDENMGRLINDRFKIIELVGKGGMGSVYLAEDLSKKGTYVAIKMLHAQLSEDKISVKRFQQEASAASDLNHPNLIRQYDYGMIDEKQPFLVMEYLQGDSLSEIIREQGPINPLRCLKIFSQVMDGLNYAHDKGVLHRDIKPSNILLMKRDGEDDLVKVLDFGLAKLMPWSGKESQHLTKTGEVFGSPIYMSPEQCMGKKLEQTSDIYSLGITLFEALTGKPPFKGQNVVQTASKHISDPPPTFESVASDLNLPLNLQTVIFKALEKEPLHRFHKMNEFKEALNYAVTGQGQATAWMLAAMTPDATQPVKKVDLDSLKNSSTNIGGIRKSEARSMSSRPLTLILVAFLMLLGGSACGYFFMTKNHGEKTADGIHLPLVSFPKSARGVVYYVEERVVKGRARISEAHIKTDKGMLYLTASNLLPSAKYREFAVGNIWKLDYKGDDKTGELSKFEIEGNDPDVFQANSAVSNFFANLADDSEELVFQMFTDEYLKKYLSEPNHQLALRKIDNEFAKDQLLNYARNKFSSEKLPFMTSFADGQERLPATQASKIYSVEPGKIVVLADTKFFYLKSRGYYRFTLKKVDKFFKIDSIDKGLAEDAWNFEF
ncbi:MAG: serine/threonine protein kinase [Candidatus Obscuribacterales bacterium]|nr:serine/threonine protein kinase [Candidatus Obscuribacterales bacterium]